MESPVLDKYDRAAIIGLLIRLVRLQDAQARDREFRAEIDARLAESSQQIVLMRRAFSAFGFDASKTGVWDRVRERIGDEAFKTAIAIGHGEIEDVPAWGHRDSDGTAALTNKPAVVDDSSSAGDETKPADQPPHRISEMILEFLKVRGEEGARVGDIKEYIQNTYGIEMHDKTPGMTLFRLQKQDRVARHGRIWYFVPAAQNGEAGNPGATTPGPNNSQT